MHDGAGITGHVVEHSGYEHEALLYAGHEDFLRHTVPFVRDAVASDEPILVVVGSEKLTALHDELAGDAGGVLFEDMSVVGRNPARLIPLWQQFVAEHSSSGRPLRGIGEPVWAGRSEAERSECDRHEALLNVAFDNPNFWLLCPYDITCLEPEVIDAARRNHPALRGHHAGRRSPNFVGTSALAQRAAEALPDPPANAFTLEFGPGDLPKVRSAIRPATMGSGISDAGQTDLVTAVNEVATNSIRHGGGGGRLRVWQEMDRVVCEVSDNGRIDDPLADRRLPVTRSGRGYGLWISNQLCDLVQLRTTARGTVVRLHKQVAAPPEGTAPAGS